MIPILNRINSVFRIDTYFFKIHSDIVIHLRLGLPEGLRPICLPVKIFKALLSYFILTTCPAHLNPLDLIRLY